MGEPDVFDSAAIYIRDFASEHHVSNANKRCGFRSMEVFLDLNGITFKHDKHEASKYVKMEVVVNQAGHEDIKEWILAHSSARKAANAC
jgi:death-on-curing family protein